ncbi:hypothetical protein DEO72_LG4g1533 [Vigna unguiculata]|uniref:Uncharacterized protein n=1 Tax=Vigna unguiculata TaxID=3917 RepID=A0A4D6LR56_VIGUN|nr:hypothetical protein DEO72_LG4g1533 [Vigna unguiculata]
MDQFSLTTRLALNEFQASCYSHHRSQSALSETNWLLRASGCNLNLNPYLVIQMGHHHGHPLTGNKQAPKRRTASPNPSLRLKGFAQARRARSGEPPPPSPRRGFDEAPREHHGISLRRDPSRLSEVFTRSKVRTGRLGDLSRNGVWASLRQARLGEPNLPGRD